jgi:hypothetical protein
MNLTIQINSRQKEPHPMKRNSLYKGLAVSVALSALLTGCGTTNSSNQDETDNKTIKTTSISGKAIDGYLQDAVVCLDLNEDGYCQANSEPLTTTLVDGSFKLDIKPEHKAHANYHKAMLLIFGGKDIDTGVDFTGKLFAPNDGSSILNVSPVTTLVAKNVQKALQQEGNLTKEQIQEHIKLAKQKVAAALDITEEEVDEDPVARKNAGDDKLIRTSLKLQKALEAQLAAAKVADKDIKEKTEDLYEALADGLDDLAEGEVGVDKLYEKAAEKRLYKETLKVENTTQMLLLVGKIGKNLDRAFDEIEGDDDLEKIAAITRDNIKDIKDSSDLDSVISVIEIDVNDPRLKAEHDWAKEFISLDLVEVGIEPTNELVDKLKDILKDEIKPGVLFEETKKLKDSQDQSIVNVYQKILQYKEKFENAKEAEEIRYSDEVKVDLKSILSDKILYIPDVEEGEDEQKEIIIDTITFDKELKRATDQNGKVRALEIEGNLLISKVEGEGREEEEDVLVYKTSTDNYYEFVSEDGYSVKFFKEKEKAESFAAELKKRFESTFPIDFPSVGDAISVDTDKPTEIGSSKIVGGILWTEVSTERMTYQDAAAMCQQLKMQLPTLTQLETNAEELKTSGVVIEEAQNSVVWSDTTDTGFWFDSAYKESITVQENEVYYTTCVKVKQ